MKSKYFTDDFSQMTFLKIIIFDIRRKLKAILVKNILKGFWIRSNLNHLHFLGFACQGCPLWVRGCRWEGFPKFTNWTIDLKFSLKSFPLQVVTLWWILLAYLISVSNVFFFLCLTLLFKIFIKGLPLNFALSIKQI